MRKSRDSGFGGQKMGWPGEARQIRLRLDRVDRGWWLRRWKVLRYLLRHPSIGTPEDS